MRGVRGKRGVWPPLGLCALFRRAVGVYTFPIQCGARRGKTRQKRREDIPFFWPADCTK